jgi:serine protease
VALAVTQGALAPFYPCDDPANDGVYIVLFHKEVAPNLNSTYVAEQWISSIVGSAKVRSAWSNLHGLAVELNADQLSLLRQESVVFQIEENCMYHLPRYTVESAVAGLPGWGQYRSDQNTANFSSTGSIPFNPPATAAANGGGSQRNVYVLDTGVRITHDEFKVSSGSTTSRATAPVSFVIPLSNVADQNGHGTHVAGTVAGLNAGYDTTANIIAVKVLNAQGSGTTQGILDGMNWVINNRGPGTNIIQMSLGGTGTSLNSGVTSAYNAGISSIVAAGNDNQDAINSTPCNAANSICVASSDSTNTLSSFSNWGTTVNIIAPGSSIMSSWYDADNSYMTISGTSMATPAVSGVASILGYLKPSSATAPNMRASLVTCSTKGITNVRGTTTPNNQLYDRCSP